MVLETLVPLIPVGAAFYGVCTKVIELRKELAVKEAEIDTLNTKLVETTTTSATASAENRTARAMIFAGVAVSGCALAYNGVRLWSRMGRRQSGAKPEEVHGLSRSSAPANYQPTVSCSESDCCTICYHNQRDTLVLPCHHLALCWVCAETLTADPSSTTSATPTDSANPRINPDAKCPICRRKIEGLTFAYVA